MTAIRFFSQLLLLLLLHFKNTSAFSPVRHSTNTHRHFTKLFETLDENDYDVVIVGGGPAGLTCALYTARSNLKTLVLDKNPAAGALAITSTIANYPGVDPTMSGEDLLEQMRDQSIQYGTNYQRAQVFMVDIEEDNEKGMKTVSTPEGVYRTKTLVLATGALGRKPNYKGEADFLGKGVSYCATCDGAFYVDSEVCVVGVTTEAMEEAEHLTKFAKTVHWITPRPMDETQESVQSLLSHSNVNHMKQTKLMSVEGDVSGVTGVKYKHMKTEDEEVYDLPVEGVFIYDAGSKPITDYLCSKIALNEDGGVTVDEEMATNVPGVYAIGDIRNTPFKQVVVAAADGCIAAMAIDRYLKKRKNIRVDWIHE